MINLIISILQQRIDRRVLRGYFRIQIASKLNRKGIGDRMNYLRFSNSHCRVVYSFRMMLAKNMDRFHRNSMNQKIACIHHSNTNNSSNRSICMMKVGMAKAMVKIDQRKVQLKN